MEGTLEVSFDNKIKNELLKDTIIDILIGDN